MKQKAQQQIFPIDSSIVMSAQDIEEIVATVSTQLPRLILEVMDNPTNLLQNQFCQVVFSVEVLITKQVIALNPHHIPRHLSCQKLHQCLRYLPCQKLHHYLRHPPTHNTAYIMLMSSSCHYHFSRLLSKLLYKQTSSLSSSICRNYSISIPLHVYSHIPFQLPQILVRYLVRYVCYVR